LEKETLDKRGILAPLFIFERRIIMSRNVRKEKYKIPANTKMHESIEKDIKKKLGIDKLAVLSIKITEKTLYPNSLAIETFGYEAMPITLYNCTLEVNVDREFVKAKAKDHGTKSEAIKSACNKIVKLYNETIGNLD
jgi:hypothetical protein